MSRDSTTLIIDEADLPTVLAVDLARGFEGLVLAYQDRLFSFALRLTSSPQDAEEIVQDAFIRAYNALRTYPPERRRMLVLRPWLYQIVLNVTRNRMRGRRVDQTTLDDEETKWHLLLADDETRQPEVIYERDERQGHLITMLMELPARYREAVILRYVEDLSYADMSRILEQPVGTIKSNVHRGVVLLREARTAEPDEVRS
jgi:RNA polymerase sigma-70 factor, ECF subfamily